MSSGRPCSTIRPRESTSTRSARSAATPRSWVIISSEIPDSRTRLSRWSRIRRCTVTSRALVGSSAISSAGWPASAIAIRTRWRMPPDISCGYWRARSTALSRPACSSASMTSAESWRLSRMPRLRTASATVVPTRRVGLRPTIGSWGTRPMTDPRMARGGARTRRATSSPSTSIRPAVTCALVGSSPMIALAAVVLPDPDSPTRATVSPGAICRSRPSSAWRAAPRRKVPRRGVGDRQAADCHDGQGMVRCRHDCISCTVRAMWLTLNTTATTNTPGSRASHGEVIR